MYKHFLKIKSNRLKCFLKLQNKYSKLSVRDGMAATFSRTNNLYQQNNGKCDKGYKKNGPLVFLAQGGKEGKEKKTEAGHFNQTRWVVRC